MSSPLNRTDPRIGFSRPLTTFRIVVFPAPFAPMMTVIDLAFASRPTPQRTWVPSYPASTPSRRSMCFVHSQVRFDDCGIPDDILRCAFGDFPPFIDDDHAIRQGEHGPHHVLDNERPEAELLLKFLEQPDRRAQLVGREASEDFVKEEHLGAGRNRARELEPLPLLSGEDAPGPVRRGFEADQRKDAVGLVQGISRVAMLAPEHRGDADILADRHRRERPVDLMGPCDPSPNDLIGAESVDAPPVNCHRARSGLERSRKHAEERRLPGPVRADQSNDPTLLEVEREPPHRVHSAEALVDVRRHDAHAHSRILRKPGKCRRMVPTIPSGISRATRITMTPIAANASPRRLGTVRAYQYDTYTMTAPKNGPTLVPIPPTMIMASMKREKVRSKTTVG